MNIKTSEKIFWDLDTTKDDTEYEQKKWVAVDDEIRFLKSLRKYVANNTIYAGMIKREEANAEIIDVLNRRIQQLDGEK